MLVSIPVCLLFISILVASSPYLSFSSLIAIWIYLLLKCVLSDISGSLFTIGDYAVSIDLQDAYLCILIVKHICHFLWFVWHNMPYYWKVLPFGLATVPRVFTALTKPILFLCHHKGFCIVFYLDDTLVLVCSKLAGKRACSFLCSLVVCLALHINSDLCLTQTFCYLGLCWDTLYMSASLPPDKLADIQLLALSLLQWNVLQSIGSCSF